MQIYSIETGNLRLDGGAMFGVVPKSLWNKAYPADENNLVNLAMRALLVCDSDRTILIDTGIGRKQDERFFGHYYLNGTDTLQGSLAKHGIKPTDITDVLFTHLHFDHCGGAVELNHKGEPVLAFPNACHWVSRRQWLAATQPNARERASFLPENILPIDESGKLILFDEGFQLTTNISVRLYDGHTAGQAVPFVQTPNGTLVYIGDVIPSAANVPLSWLTAYDMQPLVALEEKQVFLDEAAEQGFTLFFEHDIFYPCCSLKKTEKGVRVDKQFTLEEFLA